MNEVKNSTNSGVDRKEAKEFLKQFLESKNYKVLAIKGEWGVGKTYLIQNFLSTSQYRYRYYHASVFGIYSIQQLKARLLANYLNRKDSKRKSESVNNWFNKQLNNFFEWINRNSVKFEKITKLDFLPVNITGLGSFLYSK